MINTPKKHSLADLNELTRAIVSVCENEPAIAAAYLFGSYANGKQKPDSDIDVAVLLDDARAADFSVLAFTSAVEKNLGHQADIVILNQAGEVLKFEIRLHGTLIYERFREYRKQFEIMGRRSYEDFLYLHHHYVNAVLYGGAHGRQDPY